MVSFAFMSASVQEPAPASHARAVEVLARSSGGARMLCAGATKLCRASGGTMDAFSEVLSGVRLKGAMFFSAEFSAPWRLSTPHCRVLAATLAPGAPHILIYHFVVHGSARAALEDGSDVELSPGDIVVFPHGDPHRLSGGSGANDLQSAAILRKIAT